MKGQMDLRGVAVVHGVEVETMWTNEFPFRCRVKSNSVVANTLAFPGVAPQHGAQGRRESAKVPFRLFLFWLTEAHGP